MNTEAIEIHASNISSCLGLYLINAIIGYRRQYIRER